MLDYRDIEVLSDSVVYCDPPYRNTASYSGMDFDHEAFYRWLRTIDFPVYISEYSMPSDFVRIAVKDKQALMSGKGSTGAKPEGLWMHERWIDRMG